MKVYRSKSFALLGLLALLSPIAALAQSSAEKFPTKRAETRETWRRDGLEMINRAKKTKLRKGRARNVILFVGDGMGIATVTAARILAGQQRGESGEENSLSFETFPFSAFSKTYSVNQQTADSAPTMVAIVTGIKTIEGVVSVDQNAVRSDHTSVKGREMPTILELAELSGRSTGIVTTARLTHATPAATYAHTPDRNWESDADIKRWAPKAWEDGFPDIARQFVEFPYGDGIDVAFGGGRSYFLPETAADPENEGSKGRRLDGRDLAAEWTAKRQNASFVWNREQFEVIDARRTGPVLGLFERSHMQYEYDRRRTGMNEPSLSEMTGKAIDILSRNDKGFFLMVEGGRIDHAHHEGNAFRALDEAVELSRAVETARQRVDLDDTLIIVTADHSHTLIIAGYSARGNNILGLTRDVADDPSVVSEPAKDKDGKPYTALGYGNGPGGGRGERPELDQAKVTDPDYVQEAIVPLNSETHAGEDVPIFAAGVNAWMIRGVMEQNWIFYVMREAMRLDEEKLLRGIRKDK
ncbi:MAG: alkaline phosphatase [Acidobacteriota bacterium]|nr:MAG: alkaline phosphatase [Acidobacteriota bacterium]